MSKFTPGPWEVCAVDGGWDGVKPVNQKMPVCALVENNLANAALIAAAPAMYEALKNIFAIKRTVDLNLFDIEAIHSIAEAALRVADGGE